MKRGVGSWKDELSPCCSHKDSAVAQEDAVEWARYPGSFLNSCGSGDQFTVVGSEMSF